MSATPRFSLRAAVTDSVSTGRREDPPAIVVSEQILETASPPTASASRHRTSAQTKRPASRQGARGVTVWVEPEIYRMIKLVGLDSDMTTQDVMMEAINDFLSKKGKGRIAKTR